MARRRRRCVKYVSKVETRLVEFLRRNFLRVDAQVRSYDQRIDAYIPELDTFVQLDGVFWHGLDENAEKDRKVLKKMKRDLLLNGMFAGAKNGAKLFRISDAQWEFLEKSDFREHLVEVLRALGPGLTIFDGEPGYIVGKKT